MNETSINQQKKLYGIQNWGQPYFDINDAGHVIVKINDAQGDLYELITSLVQRGIEPPILIRLNGIIRDRIHTLHTAFQEAIRDFNYRNTYQIAYPIKVNPQNHIVEVINQATHSYSMGLEVGSKPELLAVLTLEGNSSFLLCNGYKDAEYIEIALLSKKLGKRPIIIVEQAYELKLILEIAQKLEIDAEIGFRMKPTYKGSGRWTYSGGDFAKFGLNSHEIVQCLEELKNANKLAWLKLLHVHIGSQITSIEAIKKALAEAARMYTEIAKLCPSLAFFDAGGGLGIDYDGSKTTAQSSMNYSVGEYARDVVFAIGEACLKANLPDPIIITESGRAIVAQHAILITEVIDVSPSLQATEKIDPPPTSHEVPQSLYTLYQETTSENCLETLHDALELKEKIIEGFVYEDLNLTERAYSEQVYRRLLAKIRHVSRELEYVPEDIENLDKSLFDLYFCNFSVFQSIPDSWAIDQQFPIMPIHRLTEKPNRRAILADISCDSDGKIDHFIMRREIRPYIQLHEPTSLPYYIGIFFVGAYQEIMGGLHNLFGDTNAVHVELNADGSWEIQQIVEGDTIEEVLSYTQYQPKQMLERLRHLIEKALKEGLMSKEESAQLQKKMKQSLESYTYLVV